MLQRNVCKACLSKCSAQLTKVWEWSLDVSVVELYRLCRRLLRCVLRVAMDNVIYPTIGQVPPSFSLLVRRPAFSECMNFVIFRGVTVSVFIVAVLKFRRIINTVWLVGFSALRFLCLTIRLVAGAYRFRSSVDISLKHWELTDKVWVSPSNETFAIQSPQSRSLPLRLKLCNRICEKSMQSFFIFLENEYFSPPTQTFVIISLQLILRTRTLRVSTRGQKISLTRSRPSMMMRRRDTVIVMKY